MQGPAHGVGGLWPLAGGRAGFLHILHPVAPHNFYKKMKDLRDKIARHIEEKMFAAQSVCYNHRDRPYIETKQEVYLQLADAIIPMVKEDLNKKKQNIKPK